MNTYACDYVENNEEKEGSQLHYSAVDKPYHAKGL